MSYDINAIKEKIAQLSKNNNRGGGGGAKPEKIQYFKPTLGAQDLRFLPNFGKDGQPFLQIDYYDSRDLTERRIVTPTQWGLEDPVADLLTELEKDRSNDAVWNLMRKLRVKESNYAAVLVRGQEDKGVQIWELNQTVLTQIYSILAHPDYVDDDMFDADTGFDFTITCTDSGKTTEFAGNTYPVKNYDVQPRRKPSKLAKTKKEAEAIVASIPDLESQFKKYVMSPEKLKVCVTNFLSAGGDASHSEEAVLPTPTSTPTPAETEASSKIDSAFADLDD